MKVVCIDNKVDFSYSPLTLTIGKIYDVIDFGSIDPQYKNLSVYGLKNDNHIVCHYFKVRFISLKEYRKQKLEKLNGR
jgi:hypothetical protein